MKHGREITLHIFLLVLEASFFEYYFDSTKQVTILKLNHMVFTESSHLPYKEDRSQSSIVHVVRQKGFPQKRVKGLNLCMIIAKIYATFIMLQEMRRITFGKPFQFFSTKN